MIRNRLELELRYTVKLSCKNCKILSIVIVDLVTINKRCYGCHINKIYFLNLKNNYTIFYRLLIPLIRHNIDVNIIKLNVN